MRNTIHRGGLGERIRAARIRAGLSHDKLGSSVGTSRQHLIRLERGLHRPRPAMLARIAEATGQPLEFFADEDDEEPSTVPLLLADLQHALVQIVLNSEVFARKLEERQRVRFVREGVA